MEWGRFMLFNVTGGILWAGMFGAGAYALGHQVRHIAGPVGIAALVLVLAAIVAGALFVRHHHGLMQARAERAFPGPLRPRERVTSR